MNNFQLFNYSSFFRTYKSCEQCSYIYDCNYYCVNIAHVRSLSVVLICVRIRFMLTETNKQYNLKLL